MLLLKDKFNLFSQLLTQGESMKFFTSVFILFFTTQTFAFNLYCGTYQPTTSIQGSTTNSIFRVQLINHNGPELMPINTGMVTTNDFPYLQEKSKLLLTVGKNASFFFNKNDCEEYKDGSFRCYGDSEFTGTDNNTIRVKYFSKSKIVTSIMDENFEETRIVIQFDFGKASHDVIFKYNQGDCLKP